MKITLLFACSEICRRNFQVEKKDHKENALFGHHGYEPTDNDMRALFLASGPSEYEHKKEEVFFRDFHAWIRMVGPATWIYTS